MSPDRTTSIRLWMWRGLAVLLIVVFFTVRAMTRDQLPVRVAQAPHLALTSTDSTNGRVEPVVNYQVYSPLATTVKEIDVQPGDQVPAGKLLMVLDDTMARARVASAESGVKAAQAAVEAATHNGTQQERQMNAAEIDREKLEEAQARQSLDALTKLKTVGAASQSEVAAAQQRVDTAGAALHASEQSGQSRYSPAEVDRAQAALGEAEANLAAARQVLNKTAIRAQAAGTVYSINVGRTEFAEEGKLLLQMADLTNERVRAYFDEPDIGRLAVGQEIQIKWDAKPGLVWKGHIERTPVTVITYGTRNVGEVLVKIDDPDSGLLPETNVTVTVTTASEPNALSIPREALHSENAKPFVYKVVGSQLQKTSVVTGTINLTQVAIVSGLADGDMVAVGSTNGQPLAEGVQIKVVR